MKKCKKTICRAISFMLAIMMIVTLVPVDGMEVQAASKKKNVVILYFSATGTTKSAASRIKKKTKGKMIEIKAADPYTSRDLDYNNDDSRVARENASASSPAKSKVRPKIANLKTIKKAVKKADVVYIGYPIWWEEAPHIMYTLVENVSLKKKTVVPFCTSHSSGMGASARHLKSKANISSKTKWLKGRNFYGAPSQNTVNKWIDKLKY